MNTDDPLYHLHRAVLSLIRCEGRDLTLRQVATALTVNTRAGPHTVRGLASTLAVETPAICRALDVLEAASLARRRRDPADGRSVVIAGTPDGRHLVEAIAAAMRAGKRRAAGTPGEQPSGCPAALERSDA